MSTVRKGDLFEERAFKILKGAVDENRLGINPACCTVWAKKKYFSRDRDDDIIFDLSIELRLPGTENIHLLYLAECKDYKGKVPVNDVEEFISKIGQVAGLNAKGVFITTGDMQPAAFNLLKSKGMMWIQVAADKEEFILTNKNRSNKANIDVAVNNWREELERLEEIKNLYVSGDAPKTDLEWDELIEQFLLRELNAKVNWAPGEQMRTLEFLSKTILEELSIKILNDFNPLIGSRGRLVDLESFMAFITTNYGISFVTNEVFPHEKSHLNGYYNRSKNVIYINPELKGTGHYAFVTMHEISHFLLHKDIDIAWEEYEVAEDSQLDRKTGKYRLEKEKHWIEWQANYLASCLVMPKISLLWHLVEWQMNNGISKQGYVWVDNQECNILAYKKVITTLGFIFEVTRSMLEIRMSDLNILRFKNPNVKYSAFGHARQARPIGNIIRRWFDDYLLGLDDI